MQKPPSLRRVKDFPITGGLGLLAIACTALFWLTKLDLERLMVDEALVISEPWRLVTSALLHADVIHLAFNLYWLWALGSIIEQAFGHGRTAFFYVVLAAGSALAELAIFDGGIGLSGVGYGLVAFLGVLSWRDPRFRGAIDSQTVLLFVGWFFLCIAATVMDVWPVANVAHGAGALLGAIFGWAIVSRGALRVTAAIAALLSLTVFLAGATVLREHVNFSRDRGLREAHDGYVALTEDRPREARRLLERSAALRPDDADTWFNLGVAHQRLGDERAARRAFERACRVDPRREHCAERE